MMNGATRRRARSARTRNETRMRSASHPHAGTDRRALPKPDLGHATCELGSLGAPRFDAHERSSTADIAGERVVDGAATGRLLARGGVELGDATQVVVPLCEHRGTLAHCGAQG